MKLMQPRNELAALGWLVSLLLVVAGAILLIWAVIIAIRWFWDHLG